MSRRIVVNKTQERVQLLELADKEFKAGVINTFLKSKGKLWS